MPEDTVLFLQLTRAEACLITSALQMYAANTSHVYRDAHHAGGAIEHANEIRSLADKFEQVVEAQIP